MQNLRVVVMIKKKKGVGRLQKSVEKFQKAREEMLIEEWKTNPPSEEEINISFKEFVSGLPTKILQDPKLIEILCDEAQKKIVGERDTIKTILICANGRNVENHNIASYNLLVNSESGAGKDYVVDNTLSILPKTEYIKRTRISPTVFTYWHNPKFEPEWTWNKKLFYCEDLSSGVLNSDVFKVMCSTGSSATVVMNQQAIDIEINGKPVMIITTASATPSKELTRRFSIINLNETIDQTTAIMKRTAEAEAKGKVLEQDPKIKEALLRLKRVKVLIPYSKDLVNFFPKKHLVIRTHFSRFLDLIKSSTSLYQYQREMNENGYYLATGQDYNIARDVLLKMTSNPYMIPLTQEQRKILNVFEDLENGVKSIVKYRCPNCQRICEVTECPKCLDYSDGKKIKFTTEQHTLKEFSHSDLEPLMTFFTGSERWFRKQLAILVSYGFLKMESEKRVTSDRPVNVYSYINLISINIPKWKEICQNTSNTTNTSISSKGSNSSNTQQKKAEKGTIGSNGTIGTRISGVGMEQNKLKWDPKAVIWQHCDFPVGNDQACADSPCNEYNGLHYCKKHFEAVQNGS